MSEFSERLNMLRKAAGITQPDLAEMCEVSPDTLRRWEWGKQEPRLGELLLLAKALGVDIGELVTGQKPGAISIKSGDVQMDIPSTPEGYLFAEAKFRELTSSPSPDRPV